MSEQRTGIAVTLWRRRFDFLVGILGAIILGLIAFAIIGLLPPDTVPGQARVQHALDSNSFPSYLGLVELLLVLAAFALTAFHFRHQRAASFIERFNSPEVISMRGRVDDWLAGYEESALRQSADKSGDNDLDDETLQLAHMEARLLLELQRDRILDKTVKAFANLFQEVGEAYENRTVSPSYTRRMFDFLAPHYWRLLQFWVDDYRIQGSPTLYSRFGQLAETIEEDPKKLALIRRKQSGGPHDSPTSFALERRAMLTEASQPKRIFIFGYGSLIASRSRQHAVADQELRTAVLHGYARAWNTVGQVIFDDDEESSPVLFLGLALSRDGACNGLLAETEAAELPFLDRREKYYLRIDVTPWIELDRDGPIANAAIYTYVARPECFYDPVRDTLRWEGLGVAQGYRQLIEDGLAERPTEFADAFRRQTWPIPAGIETISRPYRFPDPEQNRATGRDRPAEDGGPARD